MDDQRSLAEAADGFDLHPTSLVPIRSRPGMIVSWALVCGTLVSMYLLGHYGQTHCRDFSWEDQTINMSALPDVYPSWTLVVAGILPVFTVTILSYMVPVFPGSWRWELHEAVLAIGIAYAICRSVVDPSTIYAGRLRPDFLSRVRSLGFNSTVTNQNFDYCSVSELNDWRHSFPSSNSSVCFTAATLVALFVGNRLRVFAQPAAGYLRLVYFVVATGVIPFAGIVAISRTRTDSHHFADILAGMIIGIASAVLGFRLQYTLCPKRRCFVPTTLVPQPLPPAVIYKEPHYYTDTRSCTAENEKEEEEEEEGPSTTPHTQEDELSNAEDNDSSRPDVIVSFEC